MSENKIPDLFCHSCRKTGEPGAGYLRGPAGLTQQIAFWCRECGRQISVADEWSCQGFCDAVLRAVNPFTDEFPGFEERMTKARRPLPASEASFAQTREVLLNLLDEGVTCPTCDQHAQRYYRRINSGMARWLMVLVSMSPRYQPEWVQTRDVIRRAASLRTFGSSQASGEAPSLLPFWGLIECRPNDDPEKRHSGVWRPTTKGYDFVEGKVGVPRVAVVYNNRLERLEGDEVHIRQALGKRFNYEELMGAMHAVHA